MAKIKRVGTIGEFMARDYKNDVKAVKQFNKKFKEYGLKASIVAGSLAVTFNVNDFAYAATPGEYIKETAKEKIVAAFDPLVDLVQALSYPIASVMLATGALMFMINQKDRAITLIQNASIGYILMQLTPLFMKILIGLTASL